MRKRCIGKSETRERDMEIVDLVSFHSPQRCDPPRTVNN